MTAIMRCAADSGLCSPIRFKRPKIERKTADYATADWFEAVIPQCLPRLAALLLFMAFTGARVSEACRLTWSDVDLTKRRAVLRQTKNGDPRTVALADPVFLAPANLDHRLGSVFGYKSRSSVYGPLRTACRRAAVKYLSPHECGRHSFAAQLLAAGCNLRLVQEAGDWKSIRIVAETYGHLEESAVHAAVQSLGKTPQNPGNAKSKGA